MCNNVLLIDEHKHLHTAVVFYKYQDRILEVFSFFKGFYFADKGNIFMVLSSLHIKLYSV